MVVVAPVRPELARRYACTEITLDVGIATGAWASVPQIPFGDWNRTYDVPAAASPAARATLTVWPPTIARQPSAVMRVPDNVMVGAAGRVMTIGVAASHQSTAPVGGVSSTRHDHEPVVRPGMVVAVVLVPAVRTPLTVANRLHVSLLPYRRARMRADPFDAHVVGRVHTNAARSGDDSVTTPVVQAVPTAPADEASTPAVQSVAAMRASGLADVREGARTPACSLPARSGGARHPHRLPPGRQVLTNRSRTSRCDTWLVWCAAGGCAFGERRHGGNLSPTRFGADLDEG
jgi:hypothetical protein